MTLDSNYLHGIMAAVLSMLQHSTCPKNLSFHFLSTNDDTRELFSSIKSTFPYLNMKIYRFHSSRVRDKIYRS
ncbi:galacturonosyltransferase-like 4 [Vigna angularis]|uniref:Galacturonosyltransferase-like 4 n=1 Tax=Phaseolus angularis TaxID=3914 RepID=A0A8T0L6N0_PHAAN|nr:galacturonosyltransferase-like 4 [Vigna angularis]